jgi:ferrous iron transport protein A
MPLAIAPINTELIIVKIMAEEKTKKHLESLGITISSKLTVLSHSNGNIICIVKDGRLALDNDISTKILVA